MGDSEARFFPYLAADTLFPCLVHVEKSARQVQSPFGRFFCASAHEQFAPTVLYQGYRGCTGVEVIGEATLGTTFRFLVVFLEVGRAAHGAVAEFI